MEQNGGKRCVPPSSRARNILEMRINHFCARCSVFENDESVNGLESRQFGGVLRVVLLTENDNEVVNLEETDDRNEFNEEL